MGKITGKMILILTKGFRNLAVQMQANYVNINGRLVKAAAAAVPHDNRTFRYGYGLFETILFRKGQVELKGYHAERLFSGARQMGFELHAWMDEKWLEEQVQVTVAKNRQQYICRVRLQLFAPGGGIFEMGNNRPGYIIECFPLDEATIHLNDNGLVLGIAQNLSKSIDSLANIKSCNALLYVMAARQSKTHQWNDALITNQNGNIIESSIANLFLIKDKVIYTPPLSEGCVAGVMRRHLINILPGLGYHIKEQALTMKMLAGADEVFLTNAIRRIKWVSSLGDINYKCAVIRQIYNAVF